MSVHKVEKWIKCEKIFQINNFEVFIAKFLGGVTIFVNKKLSFLKYYSDFIEFMCIFILNGKKYEKLLERTNWYRET